MQDALGMDDILRVFAAMTEQRKVTPGRWIE
jgi:hypothetical protein